MTDGPSQAYLAGWEYASTRAQVTTDRPRLAYECGEQAIELFGGGQRAEELADFGQGAMDFVAGRFPRHARLDDRQVKVLMRAIIRAAADGEDQDRCLAEALALIDLASQRK